ncbi:unnamed protein product [Discosporangium mesarthrocarpum]
MAVVRRTMLTLLAASRCIASRQRPQVFSAWANSGGHIAFRGHGGGGGAGKGRPPSKIESSLAQDASSGNGFEVLSRDLAYSGWRKIVRNEVRMPTGHVANFDVLSQDDPSVAVFVWHTESKTLTLIKEYAPGREVISHGVVAGLYETSKHSGPLQAAQYELEEEAHLMGGVWYPLLQDEKTTIAADKYSTNEFYCWLCVDPHTAKSPRPADIEEFIEIEAGVSLQEALGMIARGEVSIISGFTIMLAAEKLRSLGLVA